ncbi:hypothetical protein [Scleromatobacter humisilvae]|uniref:Uncharacterized protein n=1 Tax=Scleromatobacter humisilvae TaxID=2897159 RepID=A0A9X2C0D1_9BURK|nr:hypothetical protein [Scleromatobacter humisilvae]MCK9687633.1 hypothetical protein [Scleromatobacter humisilvae]
MKKRQLIATESPTETLIVNNRHAHRNVQALVGGRAFVRGTAMSGHGGSEDRPDPGGSRV